MIILNLLAIFFTNSTMLIPKMQSVFWYVKVLGPFFFSANYPVRSIQVNVTLGRSIASRGIETRRDARNIKQYREVSDCLVQVYQNVSVCARFIKYLAKLVLNIKERAITQLFQMIKMRKNYINCTRPQQT